jgi:hypothetical protein
MASLKFFQDISMSRTTKSWPLSDKPIQILKLFLILGALHSSFIWSLELLCLEFKISSLFLP